MFNIKQKTVANTFWNAFATYTNQVLLLAVSAVLARLLTPADFGIVAMILVFSGFIQIYADAGFGPAVIQNRDLDDNALSSIFWGASGIGIILFLLFGAFSPLIAKFYSNPDLKFPAIVMGSQFIFASIGIVPQALLKKHLQFKKLAIISIASTVTASAIALFMAFNNYGYWALIWRGIFAGLISIILLLSLTKQKFQFHFKISDIKSIWKFSVNILGFRTINYFGRNADNLLIGKFLGASPLGFYNRAYALMTLPISMTTQVLTPVLHPVFANIQNDKERIAKSYYKILHLIASVSFPMMFFLSVMADEVILTIWGDQWTQSIDVFRILAIIGAFQTIISTTGTIFLATSRSDLYFKSGIFMNLVLLSGIVIGLNWGILGVAIGYAFSYLLIIAPMLFIIADIVLSSSFYTLIKNLVAPFGLSTLIYLVFLAFKTLFLYKFSNGLSLFIAIILFIIIFLIFTFLFNRKFIVEISQLIPDSVYIKIPILNRIKIYIENFLLHS